MSVDSQKFKSSQRQGWDSVAEGWKKWWKVIEEGGQVVSNRLVELARVQEGSQVLDIATGIGEPAVTAARKAGPGGKVTAIDISPGMLALAKERAREMGVSNIDFQEGDAEGFRLPVSKYNAVLSRFGIMFFPDLLGTLKTMKEALVQEGRIAAAVWQLPQNVPSFGIPLGIVMKETGTPAPPPGTPGPFSLADTSLLRQKFEQAGFRNVQVETGNAKFRLPSAKDYVDFVHSTAAPLNAMMADLPTARQQEIWSKVADAASKYTDSSGAVSFTNEVNYVSAAR